ncbi:MULTISPECIES: cation diffusion facilitator family transporter [Shouchella]|uniref:Cation diffusion facilitator family transporter n=2 Tax=Shouchella TaxID=2893057 RepID=A0ABY7W6I0_9BACI|nr:MULTISPECIES: cation diffusion facilitator family transporter [Shouchella]MED4129887.1 cation diffusion facilitator family transporter [Shouchella miscanthi]WDF03224.1 cation diffusion facilitator family transporter [Shouchella hunanensis]
MRRYEELRKGEGGAWLSIGTYLFLASLKLIIGYLFLSQALVADGYNNAADIIVSVAVLVGLRISQKPPDHDHPYGHFRAEHIAALLASFIMAVIGLQVILNAGTTLLANEPVEAPRFITAWVAGFSAIIMLFVYRFNRKLAEKINSQALKAASQDNKNDALVSIGVVIGIIGSHLHLSWIDPLMAFLIGLIICYTAWSIFKEASHSLTDGFSEEALQPFKSTVLAIDGVQNLLGIKARQVGSTIYADVTITVIPSMSVRTSHEIADLIEQTLRDQHDVTETTVHVEPDTT